MRKQQIIDENNDLPEGPFANNRERLWKDLGLSPILAAARLVMRRCGKAAPVKVADCGCGTGADLAAFPPIFKELGHTGLLTLTGCDITPGMVKYCRKRGLEVLEADFMTSPTQLADAQLVWNHFCIVHLEMEDLNPAMAVLAGLAVRPGVVCVAFKTGDDVTRIDPPDDRIPVARLQTFYRPDTVADSLTGAGLKVAYRITTPSINDLTYDYCWLIAEKQTI
jgi:SAM-dependent methyltransferase